MAPHVLIDGHLLPISILEGCEFVNDGTKLSLRVFVGGSFPRVLTLESEDAIAAFRSYLLLAHGGDIEHVPEPLRTWLPAPESSTTRRHVTPGGKSLSPGDLAGEPRSFDEPREM